MHMANELLSVPVAAGGFAISGVWIAAVCRKIKDSIEGETAALMGIMGAFVFAAQMVNFQLPFMPGTSGHLVGAVLLAIVLGPNPAVITLSSVVLVQCLIFQDGGILALGCNLVNMVIIPVYTGNFIYRLLTGKSQSVKVKYLGSIAACLIAVEAGALLVPFEVGISNVLTVPFGGFLLTMLGVHLIIGVIEGVITAAVICYIANLRPQILEISSNKHSLTSRSFALVMLTFTVIIACGISLLASDKPDGLEWSYAERPDQVAFESVVSNEEPVMKKADEIQSKYSLMPDYTTRNTSLGQVNTEAESQEQWTSFAGVIGAFVTMFAIIGLMRLFNGKKHYSFIC